MDSADAAYVSLTSLHRLDVLPVDDLGIRAGIRRIYSLAELPNKKTVEDLGQMWKPYCSIAC